MDSSLKYALFWGIVQRSVVVPHQRFGITYRSHLQGSHHTVYPRRAQASSTSRRKPAITYRIFNVSHWAWCSDIHIPVRHESKWHVPMKLVIIQYLSQGDFAYLRKAYYNPFVSVRPTLCMYKTRELLNDIWLWVIV